MFKVSKKKLVLLMLMLLSVFTLFVACGEEEDDDDDEKSTRTIKKEESQDLKVLDSVYQAMMNGLSVESVYIECKDGFSATKLSDILAEDSELSQKLTEEIGEVPKLKADCNKGADIYIEIIAERYNMNVRVFCATSADGEPVECEETEEEDGKPKKMEVLSR
ncbi:MAG: hypothetical protein J6L69_04885 [Lachnospiraceae bacterium]|nr:hypothetical protein [Lachnospiraceae bacterium]